jgi:hypothetical protein
MIIELQPALLECLVNKILAVAMPSHGSVQDEDML